MRKFNDFVEEMEKGYTKEKCGFIVTKNDKEGIVVCYGSNNSTCCGIAKCHKDDMEKFDIKIGKAISYARLKCFDVPAITKLTPITELKENDVVFLNSRNDKKYRILKIEKDSFRGYIYTIDFYCKEYSNFKQISYNTKVNPQLEKVD